MHGVSGKGITLYPPAKVNLYFEVLAKREDGYHDIRTLMMPVTLYDTLEIELTDGPGITLGCRGLGAPEDRTNLVHMAAVRFFERTGLKRGAALSLNKRIPVAAGLGGGSSNGAYTLMGLNRLLGGTLEQEELFSLAEGLGCDVPFFLLGGPALAEGRGERLTRVDFVPPVWLVLVCPDAQLSTAGVYQNLRLTKESGDSKIKSFRAFLSRGTQEGGLKRANDLEESASSMFPEIDNLKEMVRDVGAGWVSMTGSGPSVFGIFGDARAACKAYLRLSQATGLMVFLAQGIAR